MQESVNIRQIVMDMLLEVTKQQEYSHIVIRQVQNKYNYLPSNEKAFMKRLFEGTLERMIELDYCINCYSKVKVNKMKPVIRTIMRMGAYQILYMDSVPDSAACNESVKLAQKKGFTNLKGFVNGVLRTIARNKENIPYPSPQKNYNEYLSVKYSMPEWIVDLWLKQLGKEKTKTVLEGLLREHPVTIRFRTDDTSKIEAVRMELEKKGGSMSRHPYLDYAYIIEKTDDLTRLPGYDDGTFVIQDVSSMLAVESLGVKNIKQVNTKELSIIDVCAAPGGKSMLSADLLKKYEISGHIVSRDISENKVMLMQDNFSRCRLNNIKAEVWDATQVDENLVESADIVIADVPCSGLGVIGKKRDIKYRMNPESIESIIALQEEILKIAVSYIKKGGLLLFSTCTINQAENEEHAMWLQKELNMTPVSLNNVLPEKLHNDTTDEGYIQLLPGVHDTDGFFISVFQKK